jgi:hypothetical protein
MAAKETRTPLASPVHKSNEQRSASDPLPQPTSKPRVFVQEANDSWSFTASRHFGLGSTHPQTVEVMKTFSESCPDVLSRMTLKKQIIELNSSVNRAS